MLDMDVILFANDKYGHMTVFGYKLPCFPTKNVNKRAFFYTSYYIAHGLYFYLLLEVPVGGPPVFEIVH